MSAAVVLPERRSGRLAVPRLPSENVPAGLRVGAWYAGVFGTLWLVQGAFAAAGPVAAAAAVVPGLLLVVALRATRHRVPGRAARGVHAEARRADRWISVANVVLLVVTVPGAVVVQLLLGQAAVLPFVVASVGVFQLSLAPVVRRAHLWVAGTLMVAVPLVVLASTSTGPARTAVLGLVAGAVFVTKGVVDVALASRR